MSTILQDSFSDTNGTVLSSHTSESGATYARHGSFTVATITIEDNRAAKDTDVATAVYYVNNVTDPKFFEVEFTIIDKSDVNRSTGIEVGIDTGSDTAIIYRRQNATAWQLLTIIAGTPSATLLGASETFSAEASHTLKLRRIPETNDYECFLDNVSLGVVTISDAEFLGAGKIGIRATNSQGAGVGYHFDNLSVQSLSAPRALHRGRNFPLFDDDEINRFEFWPAIGTGVVDLPLTLADDISELADSLVKTIEYHVPVSDSSDVLSDSEAHELSYLFSLSDSAAANWADEYQLLLDHLLAFSDDIFTLTDAITLHLEQYEQFSDSLALLDASTLTLGYELPLADSANTLNDTIALTLTYHLTLGDNSDAFPSTPSLDDFNRANEDPATGWTQVFTSAANIRVLSNQASAPLSGQTAYSIFTSLTPGDEQEVYVDISAGQVSGGGLGNHAYLLLRFTGQTSDSASGYLIDAFATFVRVHRVDALGSFTTLSTQDTGIQLTAGDKFGARMRGDVLEVWVDDGTGWSLISTVADATYPSGKIGIGIHSVDNDLLLDNFGGGTAVGGLRDAFTQQLVIVDSGVLSLGLSDALNSLTESLVLGHGLIFAEDAANLSDALDVNIDQRLTLTDAIALSDNVSIELYYQLNLDDLLSLTDSNDLILTYLQTFSDVITLSDDETAQLAQLAQFADSASLADSTTLLLTHLLALSDDANLLSDTIDTNAPQGPLREVGVTDSIDTLSDAVTLQLEFRLSLADAVSLADSHSLVIGQHLALSDNAANWADFLAFTYGFGLILDDNAANFADTYAALLAHALQVADTVALTDSLATFGENYLQVDDALTLADDVDIELRGPDREVVIVDVLVLTDAISLSLGGEFQYQIVLTDAITLYDHYFDLRHPYIPSTRRHIVVPSRARTTRVPAGSRTTKVP